ncbi:MAG: DUF3108 domain-containing protein [Bdellovibrio sp.]|nr:DUF3108 domain-containing protein [Bdellovibrio sp.]
MLFLGRVGLVRSVGLFSGILILTSACIGSIRPLSVNPDMPRDLPKELKNRFEIMDSATVALRGPGSLMVEEVSSSKKSIKRKGTKKDLAKKGGKIQVASSQTLETFSYPTRRPASDPIWISERMVFGIYYFGVAAGEFSLDVLPFKTIHDRKVYHIRGQARSTPVFSLFYRLNDLVESFFDYDGNFSHRFHIVIDESKQRRDAIELNDSEKKETFYWNRWERKDTPFTETKQYGKIEPFSQDSLSALYYLRTVPLEVGKVFVFPVVSEGKSWEAVCTVLRKEEFSAPTGKVKAWVIRPQMRENGEIKNKEDSFIWISDDERRVPLRVEAKVKVGTIVAKLWKFEPGMKPEPLVAPLGPSAGETGSVVKVN